MNIVCGWVCFVRFTLEFYRLFYSKKSKADSERQRLNFAVLFLLLFMGIFSFFCGECNPLSDTHTLSLSRSISLTSRLLKFLFVHFECRLGVHCLRFPFFTSCVAFFSFSFGMNDDHRLYFKKHHHNLCCIFSFSVPFGIQSLF